MNLLKLLEMAMRTGKSKPEEYNKEDEFNDLKNNKLLELYKEINNYKIYRTQTTIYLSDKDSNYLGYVKLINPRNVMKSEDLKKYKVFVIQGSHSKLSGGFYKLMFSVIFDLGYNLILSDLMMTDEAINAWIKILNNNPNKACIYNEESNELEKYEENKDYSEVNTMKYRYGLKK